VFWFELPLVALQGMQNEVEIGQPLADPVGG